MIGPIPNPNLDIPILLPYIGKDGEAMLALWKAQMEWALLADVNPAPKPQNPDN